jgi:hypothetical protein
LQTQRLQAALDNSCQATTNQGSERYHQSKEHFLPISLRSYLAQVTEDGVTDRTAQRVGPRSLRFAVGNAQYLTLPIKVLEAQGLNLPSTKTIHRREHQ